MQWPSLLLPRSDREASFHATAKSCKFILPPLESSIFLYSNGVGQCAIIIIYHRCYQRLLFYLSTLDNILWLGILFPHLGWSVSWTMYIIWPCYVCLCFTNVRQYCKFANKVTPELSQDGFKLGTLPI
jgi:hypothetical protein